MLGGHRRTKVALKLNFSTQLSDKKKLAQIAKSLGYVQTRGQKGEGSIRALLEAIIEGEVVVQHRKSVPSNKVTKTLEQMEAEGLITFPKPGGALSKFEPFRIEGEPLSETIIRERR